MQPDSDAAAFALRSGSRSVRCTRKYSMTCATACDVVSIAPISRPPALTPTRVSGKSTSRANLERIMRLTMSSRVGLGFGVQ